MQLAPQVRVRVRLWRIWVNFRERVCHDVFGESRSTAFQIKQTLDIVRNQYPCGKSAPSFERNGTFPGPPNSLVKCTRKPYSNVKKHTHAHCKQMNEFVMKKWCNNVTTKRNGTHLLRWIHVRQTAWMFLHYVQIVFWGFKLKLEKNLVAFFCTMYAHADCSSVLQIRIYDLWLVLNSTWQKNVYVCARVTRKRGREQESEKSKDQFQC